MQTTTQMPFSGKYGDSSKNEEYLPPEHPIQTDSYLSTVYDAAVLASAANMTIEKYLLSQKEIITKDDIIALKKDAILRMEWLIIAIRICSIIAVIAAIIAYFNIVFLCGLLLLTVAWYMWPFYQKAKKAHAVIKDW